jgi:anti-sigma factor RsiW
MTGSSLPPGHGPRDPDPRGPTEHDPVDLGALALGLLDPDRARAVEAHLATCAACRRELEDLTAVTHLLGEVPPEALLEGPPDGDLVLRRTLRQMRAEATAERRRRFVPRAAAGIAAVAVLLGGGVALGRASAPEPVVIAQATPRPGGVTLHGDGATGVTMAAVVTPATGWVRISATVRGIPAGQRCRIVVVAKDGHEEVAGTWLSSARGETEGTQLDGAAIVAPDQVSGVAVENDDGLKFVELRA